MPDTTPNLGSCGCETQIGRRSRWAQGHDARAVKQLRERFESGEITRAQAMKAAKDWSPALTVKLETALAGAADRRAARKAASSETATP